MNKWVSATANNGVYKADFATSQVHALFDSLDRLENISARHERPCIFGEHLSEADIRLYTTVIRFDVAFHSAMYGKGEARGAFFDSTEPCLGLYFAWATLRRGSGSCSSTRSL